MVIWRASRLRELFRPATEIYQDADESRQFDVVYFAMLVLSCLIALLGLLLNSPAVIIGAMLISWDLFLLAGSRLRRPTGTSARRRHGTWH